jgi:hypothetical protein
MAVLFVGLFILTVQLFVLCYVISQATCARILGVPVYHVQIGFGKLIIGFEGLYWHWSVGMILLGGSVGFSQQMVSAKKGVRLGILLSGPIVLFAISAVLLIIPVHLGSTQLRIAIADLPSETTFPRTGIPSLTLANEPATVVGQLLFSADVIGQLALRFLFYKPLDGWSGILGWIYTAGILGSNSLAHWITFTGLSALLFGLSNLLFDRPNYLKLLFANDDLEFHFDGWATVCSLAWTVFMLSYTVRLVYADAVWLFKSFA